MWIQIQGAELMRIRILGRLLSHKKLNYYMKNVVLKFKGSIGLFHYLASHSDFDFEFAEIFVITVHRQPCRQQQEDAGLAQEEPHGEGDLASQLPLPKSLWTILRGAFLNEGQSTALQNYN